jgi:AcrR family transcriptional regulator
MDDSEFDKLFVASAFRLIASKGWTDLSLTEAAQSAGLPIVRVRERFPNRKSVLLRFGRMADQAALAEPETGGSLRDRLFGLIMRRIDVLQEHRDGVLALFRALPADPQTAIMLGCASERSMSWLLEAAGLRVTASIADQLRLRGLLAVWLWTVRAWRRDESADLAATMAALDVALSRADQAARWLPGRMGEGPSHSQSNEGDVAAEEMLPKTEPFTPPDSFGSPPV